MAPPNYTPCAAGQERGRKAARSQAVPIPLPAEAVPPGRRQGHPVLQIPNAQGRQQLCRGAVAQGFRASFATSSQPPTATEPQPPAIHTSLLFYRGQSRQVSYCAGKKQVQRAAALQTATLHVACAPWWLRLVSLLVFAKFPDDKAMEALKNSR